MKVWEDITQVPLPLPFELKIIKAYVIKGKSGITIVDTGLKTQESMRAWEQVQDRDGWRMENVEQIVLTHYHPDHYGLAGTLQQATQAPVKMSEKDFNQAQFFFGKKTTFPDMLAIFFKKHGLVDDLTHKIPKLLRNYGSWVEPHPAPTFIGEGDRIFLGDRQYAIYHTPGHADGHLSFYDESRAWLIGGDFLLPRITPNISLWPGCDPNPLQTYLNTLDKMEKVPVKKVFPSHGSTFDSYQNRIQELREHHERRLQMMKDYLLGKEYTAYQVCQHVFGNHLSMHNLRFALSETLAHLEYLRGLHELHAEEREGVVYFFG